MRPPVPYLLVLVVVAALAAAGAWWLLAPAASSDLVGPAVTTSSSTTTIAAPTTAPTTTTVVESAEPVALRIPDLAVESPVVPVGLEPDGVMEVPGVTEAGWYRHGVEPGSPHGSSVIAAHVDYGGERGVFFDLRRLEIGDEVEVVDAEGDRHLFVVDQRFQVDKDSLPIPELFRTDGPPALTLITCGGAFDPGARSYRDNVVVRARPLAT